MLNTIEVEELIEMTLPVEEAKRRLAAFTTSDVTDEAFELIVNTVMRLGQDKEACAHAATLGDVMDCSGTGGSGLPHFNTSTAVAFVLASGGVRVAKFGNRAARSLSGSFDLLNALGVPRTLDPRRLKGILDETQLLFLFAPQYYPALARLAEVRRSLSRPTIFNYIGPLLNPTLPEFRLLGVSDANMQVCAAHFACKQPNLQRAWIVRSHSGLDELCPVEGSEVFDIHNHEIKQVVLPPMTQRAAGQVSEGAQASRGSQYADNVPGGKKYTPDLNCKIFLEIVEQGEGTQYQEELAMISFNAGAGFLVAGVVDSFEEGQQIALDLLNAGRVKQKIGECRRAYELSSR